MSSSYSCLSNGSESTAYKYFLESTAIGPKVLKGYEIAFFVEFKFNYFFIGENMKDPEIVPLEQTLSNKIPLIPVIGHPIFPGVFTPLMVNSPDDIKSIEEAYTGNGLIGIVMLKNEIESP